MSEVTIQDREDFSKINMAKNLIANAVAQLEQLDNSFLRSRVDADIRAMKEAIYELDRLEERKV